MSRKYEVVEYTPEGTSKTLYASYSYENASEELELLQTYGDYPEGTSLVLMFFDDDEKVDT